MTVSASISYGSHPSTLDACIGRKLDFGPRPSEKPSRMPPRSASIKSFSGQSGPARGFLPRTWNTSGSCETTRTDTLRGGGKAHREVVNIGRNCPAFSVARAPRRFLARRRWAFPIEYPDYGTRCGARSPPGKVSCAGEKMRQSGALFGFFERVSTSEHCIASSVVSSFVELLLDRGHAALQV
jgi:hypothetical protein